MKTPDKAGAKGDLRGLAALAAPLSKWLLENKNPYYSVVVTAESVRLVCDEAGCRIDSGQPED